MNKLLIVLTMTMTLSACSSNSNHLTISTDQAIDMNGTNFTKGAAVEGIDITYALIVPFGKPNIKMAVEDAIDSNRCAVALTDTSVNHGFFFIYAGAFWINVEGTLVMDESKVGCKNAGKLSRKTI